LTIANPLISDCINKALVLFGYASINIRYALNHFFLGILKFWTTAMASKAHLHRFWLKNWLGIISSCHLTAKSL